MMSYEFSMLNEGLAFFGEAVFLQAAVGFIGDGALDEAGFKRWEQERSAGNFFGVVLALIGLATIDILFLLPILGMMLAVFFGVTLVCVGCVIGGGILLGNLMLGGDGLMMGNQTLQMLTSIGLLSGGIGGGALLLLVLDWVARGLIKYARLHFRLFKSANDSI